jgi:hypothetical protein
MQLALNLFEQWRYSQFFFWIASSKLLALKSSTSRTDNPPNYLEIWLWFFLLSNLDKNKHWAHKLDKNTIKRWTSWKVNSDNQKDRHNDQFFLGIRTTISLQQNGTSKPVRNTRIILLQSSTIVVVIAQHLRDEGILWGWGGGAPAGGSRSKQPSSSLAFSSIETQPPWPLSAGDFNRFRTQSTRSWIRF